MAEYIMCFTSFKTQLKKSSSYLVIPCSLFHSTRPSTCFCAFVFPALYRCSCPRPSGTHSGSADGRFVRPFLPTCGTLSGESACCSCRNTWLSSCPSWPRGSRLQVWGSRANEAPGHCCFSSSETLSRTKWCCLLPYTCWLAQGWRTHLKHHSALGKE